jgi:hypothetical protein
MLDDAWLVADGVNLNADRQGGLDALNRSSSLVPSRITSPPLRMLTARPMASLPLKRIREVAGSTKPRRTSAISPSRKVRWPARMPMARMPSTESNSPLTSRRTRSALVCTVPPDVTTLVCARVWAISAGSMPREASLAVETST